MFRFLIQMLIIITLSFNVSQVSAKEQTDEEKREDMRKMVEERKKDLNGSSWNVEIKSQGGKSVLEGADELVFQNGRFTSKKMAKRGYTSTNYTITPSETGPSVWETMQTSVDDGVVFWRGEWQKETMSGVINRQVKEGTEDYYFSSSLKVKIPPTSEEDETLEQESIDNASTAKTLSSGSEESSNGSSRKNKDKEKKAIIQEESKLI